MKDILNFKHYDEKLNKLKTLKISAFNNNTVMTVNLVLERRYGYYLTNTFFQSFSLAFLGYLTLYIHVEDFTDRYLVIFKRIQNNNNISILF